MSTVFRVEKNSNYTVMANYHLKDRRLSYKAKGLLSVILSLPPDWDYTITGLAYIAADGVESVKTAVRELESSGYISRKQLRDERGRMAENEYRVYENPEQNPDYISDRTENAPTESTEQTSSAKSDNGAVLSSPSTDLPLAENPSTVKTSAGTFNKLNKKILKTKKSNHSHLRAARVNDGNDRTELSDQKTIFSISEREYYENVIRENIDYSSVYESNFDNREQVKEMVSIMTDVVCSSAPTIRVNGEEMPKDAVKSRFLKLGCEEIDYVLYALKNNAGRIGNMRAYLITALYNSKSTLSNFFSAMAYSDMRAGRV